MMTKRVRILGTGVYLPKRIVTAEELDQKLGTPSGWVAKKSGVIERRFAVDETNSEMGVEAARNALQAAKLTLDDIDCIVSASGTVEQAIPCTASLIYRSLDAEHFGIPAFDLNATCLSFVTAFEHLSYLIQAGKYRHVLFVSSEIASIGLNWNHKESASLFGDGAAAMVLGAADDKQKSCMLSSLMKTYPQGAELSEIRGGGTKKHPRKYKQAVELHDYLFEMDGEAIFRMAAKQLNPFVDQLFAQSTRPCQMRDVQLVIPHQASLMAMGLIRRRLKIKREQMLITASHYGNMIAASIPLGLHLAIEQGKIQRDDLVLLLGTSAGLSLGGILFVY